MKKLNLLVASGISLLCLASCGLTEHKALGMINKRINRPEYFRLKVGDVLPMPRADYDTKHNVGYGYLLNLNRTIKGDGSTGDTIRVRSETEICTGCPKCYAKYKEAGLIEYEIYPDGRAIDVSLTPEGEKYAIRSGEDIYVYMGTPKATRLVRHEENTNPNYKPEREERTYTFPAYYEELSPFMKALGNKEKTAFSPISISGTAARFTKEKTGWELSLGPTYNGRIRRTY